MKLNKFFVVILPMFIFLVVFLVSHNAFAQNETQEFVYGQNDPEFKKYENSILGMKFSYPEYWGNSANTNNQNGLSSKDCFDRLSCSDFWLLPDNSPTDSTYEYTGIFGFDRFNSENQMFSSECKCDTLTEFAQYRYEEEKEKADYFLFIKDDNITINNFPAFQIEYTTKEQSTNATDLDIYTKVNNSFYEFGLSTDNIEGYSKYIPDVKKIIDSIEFIPVIKPVEKQPSFMMDTKESNNTSPIQNLTNENVIDLSNNGKQQLSESKDSNNKIGITSYNSYINSIGHLHVIGEVENNSPIIAEFVKIIGTFYDDNGNVVGTSSTYADPTYIGSGEKAPFDLILSDSTIPIDQIKEYRLTISYR
jgi:hypothetical protein